MVDLDAFDFDLDRDALWGDMMQSLEAALESMRRDLADFHLLQVIDVG